MYPPLLAAETLTGPPSRRQPSGILVPLTIFQSIGIVCILFFSAVRSRFRDIYTPRRGLDRCRPPRILPGFFSWIPVVFRTPESFLISTVGLDGVMLLRFIKMGIQLFFVLSLVGLCTLAPVNYYAGQSVKVQGSWFTEGELSDENEFLRKITVENVPQRSPVLRFHLLYLWLCSFIAYGYLIVYYRDYVNLKLQYQEHVLRKSKLSKIDMRSIMVYGIPRELRHESALAAYFQGLGLGKVDSVVICRKWHNLKNAIYWRSYYLQLLEQVYAQVMKLAHGRRGIFLFHGSNRIRIPTQDENTMIPESHLTRDDSTDGYLFDIMSKLNAVHPKYRPKHRLGWFGLFGQKVDSAEYYAGQFCEWDRKVVQLRKYADTSPATPVGFVTFESPESAIIAAQVNVASQPFACMTRMAPEPRDLYWPNISSRTAEPFIKLFRSTIVYLSLIFMVFFNTIIVSAIASLFDLDSIAKLIPALASFISSLDNVTRQFIQGVVATATLSLWNSSLPSLLLLLSQMQGLEARSWIEMSVLSKYFFYQIWNILFVVISSTVYKNVQTPKDVIEILGNSLPQASPTLINYTILQALASCPAQLLLVGPLVLTWFTRVLPWSSYTSPRQKSDAYYPSLFTSMNYGYSYAVPILVWVIGMIYAPIAPIVAPFCMLFFCVAYVVNKYLLLYVHIPQYETGGGHAPMAVRRCLAGMVIMQLTMMGVLSLKSVPKNKLATTFEADGAWAGYVSMLFYAMPLLAITAALFYWFRHGYEAEIRYLPLDLLGKVSREVAKEMDHSLSETATRLPGQTVMEHQLKGQELQAVASTSRSDPASYEPSATLSNKRSTLSLNVRETYRGSLKDLRRKQSCLSVSSHMTDVPASHTSYLSSLVETDVDDAQVPQALISHSRSHPRFSMLNTFAHATTTPRDASLFEAPDNHELASPSIRSDSETLSIHPPIPLHRGWFSSYAEVEDDIITSKTMHVEPPMTRLPGVLDVPLESSIPIIPDVDEDELMMMHPPDTLNAIQTQRVKPDTSNMDLTLYTYMHPCLIGRLPIPWLATENDPSEMEAQRQPRRLMEARQEQKSIQMELKRRMTERARMGIQAVDREDDSDQEEWDADEAPLLQPYSRRRPASLLHRFKGVLEGLTSWAHLQIS